MSQIVVAKLVNGGIAIGELAENGDINDAMELAVMPIAPGQVRIGIGPIMNPFSDDTKGFTVGADKFITKPVEAKKELADNYLQMRSGIVLATQMPDKK